SRTSAVGSGNASGLGRTRVVNAVRAGGARRPAARTAGGPPAALAARDTGHGGLDAPLPAQAAADRRGAPPAPALAPEVDDHAPARPREPRISDEAVDVPLGASRVAAARCGSYAVAKLG